MATKAQFEAGTSCMVPWCLPVDLDRTNLIEITTYSDPWARYLDTETGQIHDCADYARQAQELGEI